MKKVRVNIKNELASGGRKGWTRLVESVNTDNCNGYDLVGTYLNDGLKDLALSSVLVQRNPLGSAKSGHRDWRHGTLNQKGEIIWSEYVCNLEFLNFRDKVKELVEKNIDVRGTLLKQKLDLECRLEAVNYKLETLNDKK